MYFNSVSWKCYLFYAVCQMSKIQFYLFFKKAGQHEENICGRPLGMEFGKDGFLYVADAYHGLFRIDVKTGEFFQRVCY